MQLPTASNNSMTMYRLTHGFRRYTGNIPEALMNTAQPEGGIHKHRGYSPYTL